MHAAIIDQNVCIQCLECVPACPFGTILDVTHRTGDVFELEPPLVSTLVQAMQQEYGTEIGDLLIDPDTHELNAKETFFVDSKGRRISLHDTLVDGEVITFMVGIAGG